MNKPKIITIGVYGFTEDSFFQSLLDAKVDMFCDIRMRRGMRGAKYSFVNSKYLQMRLNQLGMQYLHMKELAPNKGIRDKQKYSDKKSGINKRDRATLNQDFINAYKSEYLDNFNSEEFLLKIGNTAKNIALFCVEKEPEACHRSLVAQKLKDELWLEVLHLIP